MTTLYQIIRIAIVCACFFVMQPTHGQKLLRAIEKVGKSAQNVLEKDNTNSNTSNDSKKTSTTNVPTLSDFHKAHIKKAQFLSGTLGNIPTDESQFVNQIDLSKPIQMALFLENSLFEIKTSLQNYNQTVLTPHLIRTYYIDGKQIAKWSTEIEESTFKENTFIMEPIVPADFGEYKQYEFEISTLAHVISNLGAGEHTLRIDYSVTINTEKPSSDGVGASYDNREEIVATGEAKIRASADAIAKFCKQYGRPKFSKGVLANNAALEKQVTDLIVKTSGKKPIYVYANDNWQLNRGALDRVLNRDVLCYYVFKNETGRCELKEIFIRQDFDGSSYGTPKPLHYNYKIFPYVVCQNY